MAQYADTISHPDCSPWVCAMKMMLGEMGRRNACLPSIYLPHPGRIMGTPTAFPFQRDLHLRVTGYTIQCNSAR